MILPINCYVPRFNLMSRCWISLTISLLFSSFAFKVVKLKDYPYKKNENLSRNLSVLLEAAR